MRIITILSLALIICSCNSKRSTPITIYSSAEDSVFYYEGDRFEPDKLIRGVQKDTVFFKSLTNKLPGKKIFFKALKGYKGGGAFTFMKLNFYFKSMKIKVIEVEKLNNEEQSYFKDITVWERP